MTETCIFHDNSFRFKYQRLLNLTRDKIIPGKYVRRLGDLICSCKSKDDFTTEKCLSIDKEVQTLNYIELLRSVRKSACTADIGVLEEVNKLFDDLFPSPDASLETFTTVDKPRENYWVMVSNSDVDLTSDSIADLQIDPNISSSQDEIPPDPINSAQQPDLEYVSSARLALLLDKVAQHNFTYFEGPAQCTKINTALTLTCDLDLPGMHLGNFFGVEGRHFKAVTDKHDVKVNISYPPHDLTGRQHKKNPRLRWSISSLPKVRAVITSDKPNSTLAIKACRVDLMDRVSKVVTRREMHLKRVAAFHERRMKNYRRGPKRRMPNSLRRGIPLFGPKEGATDSYLRKIESEKREKAAPGNHGNPKPPGVLQRGSRCLQCLTEHSEASSDGCSYHCGFPVAYERGKDIVWSCCDQKLTDAKVSTMKQSHLATGCKTGIHNWRPNQRSGQKSKRGRKASGFSSDLVNQAIRTRGCTGSGALQLAYEMENMI